MTLPHNAMRVLVSNFTNRIPAKTTKMKVADVTQAVFSRRWPEAHSLDEHHHQISI
jgi:hypothetical protein